MGKDRRWSGSPCSNRPGISTEVNIAYDGGRIIARNLGGTTAASLLAAHNGDIRALEAENAKLRAVVRAVCEGRFPPTASDIAHFSRASRSSDPWEHEYYGRLLGALAPLVEEGGND